MTNRQSLPPMAAKILMLAANGEGDTAGFIDTYRRHAGGTPIEVPEEVGYPSPTLDEAVNELIDRRLATKVTPQHMRDRKGAQITHEGYLLAEQISRSPQDPKNHSYQGDTTAFQHRAAETHRDLFISHASEDKGFVGPLAVALMAEELNIWYDEYEFQIGDNVRAKIDQGLLQSRYGLVVLSPAFFEKFWPQYEMDGLFARQSAGESVILPIWHRLTIDEISQRNLSLTNIYALNSSVDSVEAIAQKVAVKVKGTAETQSVAQPPPVGATPQDRTFGIFYIAQQGTPELPPGQAPARHRFTPTPTGWISVTATDEELEYIQDGNSLRVRLDWGNSWSGDEIYAAQMIKGSEPFALIVRHRNGSQIYLPSVTNGSQAEWWEPSKNRSGWLAFNVN